MEFLQSYTGRAPYRADHQVEGSRLLIGVECLVGDFPSRLVALLDTAAHWSLLPYALARHLGCEADPPEERLVTRRGVLTGRLHRLPIAFVAHEGTVLELDATWFVSEGWPGPAVIGWKGCLERMRFALDPFHDQLYFGGEETPGEQTAPRSRRTTRRRG